MGLKRLSVTPRAQASQVVWGWKVIPRRPLSSLRGSMIHPMVYMMVYVAGCYVVQDVIVMLLVGV